MPDRLGALGETLAVERLEALGYRILERNYRCRFGELDCVAVHRGTLVFVEIKARRTAGFGGPLEAVDRPKRRRLTRLAHQYLAERRVGEVAQRFDVVAVWMEAGGPRIEVFENAFEAEE